MSNSVLDPPSILITEDETHLCTLLQRSLSARGYTALTANDGQQALEQFKTNRIDLLLLDASLPKLDGMSVCSEIRQWSDVPIIIMSECASPDSIEEGLIIGADDYVIKPFIFRELEARIYALLRRVSYATTDYAFSILTVGGIALDRESRVATVEGKPVGLTETESNVLYNLMLTPNRPLSHKALLERIWGFQPNGKPRILHTNICRLREKIEQKPSTPRYIITVPGMGYKFCSEFQLAGAVI